MIENPEASRRGVDWRIVFWLLFGFVLLADQLVKYWARHYFGNEGGSLTVIPNVLDLTLTTNKGIAFGMFQKSGGILLAPVAIVIGLGGILYSMKHRSESAWVHIAMALLSAGALGNLLDRVAAGKVTDMFQIRAFEFPIFNVADSSITVAAVILILRWGAEWIREAKGHAPKPEAEVTPPVEGAG